MTLILMNFPQGSDHKLCTLGGVDGDRILRIFGVLGECCSAQPFSDLTFKNLIVMSLCLRFQSLHYLFKFSIFLLGAEQQPALSGGSISVTVTMISF